MLSFSFRHLLLFLLAVSLLFLGCVGKKKYTEVLLQKAAAQSELGIARLDLGDSRAELKRQEALVEGLRSEIGRLDNSVSELTDQSDNDQKQIGASLNKTQEQLDQYRAQLLTAETQLNAFKSYYSKREDRLIDIAGRLRAATAGLPDAQLSSTRSNESIVVQFGEGLLFEKSGSKLSDFGIALIQKLAGAISEQSDLLIEIAALPPVPDGSMKALEAASERANVITYQLVNEYQLSPKQVSSSAKQGGSFLSARIPAESRHRKTVELIVRLNPLRYPIPAIK